MMSVIHLVTRFSTLCCDLALKAIHLFTQTITVASFHTVFAELSEKIIFFSSSLSASGMGSYSRRYNIRVTSVMMNISKIRSC